MEIIFIIIAVVILFILLIILIKSICKNFENFGVLEHLGLNKKNRISIYVLNYKRPHNIDISLPILKSLRYVDEIIISHGSPEGYKEFEGVVNIKDYENNNKYGAGRRFLIDTEKIKNEILIIMDDDHIPSSGLLERMLLSAQKDSDQIYGPYQRACNDKGYEFNPPTERQNVVLTGLAMTSKNVIKTFQKHFSEVEDVLVKYNGNGDDLTFNYIFRKYFNKNPKYIKGDFIELDTKGGYSFTRGHNDKRNSICKDLEIIG